MKTCTRCKKERNYDGFYKDKSAKDGFNSVCKSCRLQMDRDRRENDPAWRAKRKLQNSKYHFENRESIADRKKRWFETEEGKQSHRASTKKWKEKNRTKVLAHDAVERAIKKGTLIRKTHCEVCKSNHKIEAHHPDYRKRLSILWLCKYCHEKLT